MDGLKRLRNTIGGSGQLSVASLLVFAGSTFALMGLIIGLLSLVERLGGRGGNSYDREETAFHAMAEAPRILRDSPENTVIVDDSPYARNASLALRQYTVRYYQDQMLTQETAYDAQGSRTCLHTLDYDTAGNVRTEQVADETGETQTYRHVYEYDDLGQMVHEEIYLDEKLMERNYFRYLYSSYPYQEAGQTFDRDIGYAGISFSYLNDQVDGGISSYCAKRTEFVTDAKDNLLFAIKLNSLEVDNPNEVWRMQWQERGNQVLNRVQYYKDGWFRYYRNTSDWYTDAKDADAEQFNLYECSETSEKHLILQINYNNKTKFLQTNSFYLAGYEGDLLLWQMDYAEGKLDYYSACLYDGEGRLQETVEYDAQGEEPQAFFYRYAYPEQDREDQYSYVIQGEEFDQQFGDGGQVRLAFSEDGILAKIEMTNISEDTSEIYEFTASGENAGQLRRMCAGADAAEGEREALRSLEKKAQRLGFYVGENLGDSPERSVEIDGSDWN